MENTLAQRASKFFAVTPSDDLPIEQDPNNGDHATRVWLKNNTERAISLTVLSSGGSQGVIMIAPYDREPMEIGKVFETGLDAFAEGDILAYY